MSLIVYKNMFIVSRKDKKIQDFNNQCNVDDFRWMFSQLKSCAKYLSKFLNKSY